jgi:putative phosphoesterase
MRLGIISDTHGHEHNTLDAIAIFESTGVDTVIHCGDIGSPTIPAMFTLWPSHFVFGNVDQQKEILRSAIKKAGHRCHERFGQLELEGLQIAFLHGDDATLWQETLASGQWDMLCYGHTHRPEMRWEGRTLVLNPGAVYRALPHSVAVVDLPERIVEFSKF